MEPSLPVVHEGTTTDEALVENNQLTWTITEIYYSRPRRKGLENVKYPWHRESQRNGLLW